MTPCSLTAPCVPFDTRRVQYKQMEWTHTPGRDRSTQRV